MKFNRPHVPFGLLIAAVVCLILGFAAGPTLSALTTEAQRATNVILSAIPFVLIFAAIILFFIAFIWLLSTALSHQISEKPYRLIERVLIAGIGLGIFGMFQPWLFVGYKYGFPLLLLSTLGFIVWSHITPKTGVEEELTTTAVAELEPDSSRP
ncbi:MAG TPA: hypothetical protein PKE64_29635 [Anaerolineae bacterium]|nr:hypothetical protein [Anaerolineae bacterium]